MILDAVIYVDVGGVLSYCSGEEYGDVVVYGVCSVSVVRDLYGCSVGVRSSSSTSKESCACITSSMVLLSL